MLFKIGVLCSMIFASNALAAGAAPDIKEGANGEVSVIALFEVKPGTEVEFEKTARLSSKCSRLEPGNVSFSIEKVLDGGKTSYALIEIWRNKAALQSHFVQPYTQALFASFEKNLTKPLSDGAMKFVSDLDPAPRAKPAKTDPKSLPECR